MISVTINGEPREVAVGLTVRQLLEELGLRPDRVAVERNRDILPRTLWSATRVEPNDSFEIVQFVGGG